MKSGSKRVIYEKRNISRSAISPVILGVAVVITLLVAVAGIMEPANRVSYKSRAGTPKALLSFSPFSIHMPEENAISLMLSCGLNRVASVRVQINFNPHIIQLTHEIKTAPELPKIIQRTSKSEANAKGIIILDLGIGKTDPVKAPNGLFELARMQFESTKTGKNQITPINLVKSSLYLTRF